MRRIRERDVVAISLRLFQTRCSSHDALDKIGFDNALFVEISSTQIDHGLDLTVRLFTKYQELTWN